MRTPLSLTTFFATAFATMIGIFVALCLLPSDRYLRFQSITDPAVVKAGWIYARIHYDPTPMDVVIIGTSHAVFGLDSQEVQRACNSAGGKNCATVNFALQHLGRNVHWLLTREVLQARKPKLLIVEVQETEYRALHPAFSFLADPHDIIFAPLLVNTSYLPDLARLPLRQLSLFAQERLPSVYHVQTQFVPAYYRGSHWNDTYMEAGSLIHPIVHPVPRTQSISDQLLEFQRIHAEAIKPDDSQLPAVVRQLEYRANLFYLEELVKLAHEKHVDVRFLYMPSYHTESSPSFAGVYAKFAPTWKMPRDILDQSGMWNDVNHLNYTGAEAFSAWLGTRIARDFPGISSVAPGSSAILNSEP
jgi:hypothetical protein